MVFSFLEIRDIVLMSLIVGFIFKDIFVWRKKTAYEPLDDLKRPGWNNFWFSVLVTAPAIVLHELGHKFIAMGFGLEAVFKAAYTWLGIGFLLKMLAGFIFFVPAYVQITGGAAPLEISLVAFAGPAVNLILWVGTWAAYTYLKVPSKWLAALVITSKINMLLFVFNMLPIPGFDGFKVYSGLWIAIFG